MPRLSLDARLDRLLSESVDSTRYRDIAMQLRRLTLSSLVPDETRLTDETGRVWIAGDVAADGQVPVVSEIIGASTTAAAGTVLQWDGGEVTLQAEIIASAGGMWDTLRRDWRRDRGGSRVAAQRPVVVDLMESQIETARWAAGRLAAFREQRKHPHAVAEMISDRRAGKSFLGLLIVLMLCIDCPKVGELPTVAWLVSTSHAAREELDRIIQAILPADLYKFRELPKRMFTLANGATLLHKTTDDVESLRVGYVDIAFLNEAANMPFGAYQIVLRATQDRSGFVVLATNRPKRTRGNWVIKLADGADADVRAGVEPAVKVLRLDPKLNAAISQAAKSVIDRALRYGLDAEDELDEGVILEADAKCFAPPFSLETHVRPLPQVGLVDVTAEVIRRIFGKSFNYLIGADFQQQNAAIAFKVFAPSLDPTSWRNFHMWAVRGWFLKDGGDEDDLIDALEVDGFKADNSFVVGDWSGDWQNGRHGYGPASFDSFKDRGWDIVGPTRKKTKKALRGRNPDVERSVGELRNAIQSGRFFVTPGEPAANVAKSLHKCDATVDRFGNLRPKGVFAHLGDCCRYPLHYLLTRISDVAAPLPSYVTTRR